MITDLLVQQIESCLPYEPNREQSELLQQLAAFVLDGRDDSLFLLRGYAGTGKTSLVGALVKALTQLQSKVVLLAPTGRAAKVFSRYARHSAYTIHRRIYRQKSYSPDMEGFLIGENLAKHTLFIVDEASMIANSVGEGAVYGSGRLLDDLVEYVYSGEHCRLILLGDTAQLPPVGQERSPALDAAVMGGYGLNVVEYELREVARQAAESGILYNATRLRECMEEAPLPRPCLRVNGFPDVEALSGEYLVERISDSYDRVGLDETIVVTRSNKRANIFNQGIRNQILYREEELTAGDLLLVAKNNYFWGKDYKEVDFIANGDVARVVRVLKRTDMYGFCFADVQLYFPDLEVEMEAKILLDTLTSESPSLTREQQETLFAQSWPTIMTLRQREKNETAENRSVVQRFASKICLWGNLSQSARRSVETCLCRYGVYPSGCGFARFLSLALYGFHPGDREDMAGQYERRVSGVVFIIQGSITS